MSGSRQDSKKKTLEQFFGKTLEFAQRANLVKPVCEAIVDGTGFETKYISQYYAWRRREVQGFRQKTWVKSSILCDRETHFILGATARYGPGGDIQDLWSLLETAPKSIQIEGLIADKGYDSEAVHDRCINHYGMQWTAIAVRKPHRKKDGSFKNVDGQYRRQMHFNFPSSLYCQRVQVESVFSRVKRRLDPGVASRKPDTQATEAILKTLTANILML